MLNFSLKSLKQRLHELDGLKISFGPKTIIIHGSKCETNSSASEPLDNVSEIALQTSEPSAVHLHDVAMEEEGEKPESEILVDSNIGPETKEDIKIVKGEDVSTTLISTATASSKVSIENKEPSTSSPASPEATHVSEVNFQELVTNEDILKTITAAVQQHRLTKARETKKEENMVRPSKLIFIFLM